MRTESQKTPRLVNILLDSTQERKDSALERMRRKIDSAEGRHIYSYRLGVAGPVFGHVTGAIGIRRFGLRGKSHRSVAIDDDDPQYRQNPPLRMGACMKATAESEDIGPKVDREAKPFPQFHDQ